MAILIGFAIFFVSFSLGASAGRKLGYEECIKDAETIIAKVKNGQDIDKIIEDISKLK